MLGSHNARQVAKAAQNLAVALLAFVVLGILAPVRYFSDGRFEDTWPTLFEMGELTLAFEEDFLNFLGVCLLPLYFVFFTLSFPFACLSEAIGWYWPEYHHFFTRHLYPYTGWCTWPFVLMGASTLFIPLSTAWVLGMVGVSLFVGIILKISADILWEDRKDEEPMVAKPAPPIKQANTRQFSDEPEIELPEEKMPSEEIPAEEIPIISSVACSTPAQGGDSPVLSPSSIRRNVRTNSPQPFP